MLVITKIKFFFLTFLLLSLPVNFPLDVSSSEVIVTEDGIPGTGAAAYLAGCSDSAFTYVECDDWLSNRPLNDNYYGSVVIWDNPLKVSWWKSLINDQFTDGIYIDLHTYVTKDSNGQVKELHKSNINSYDDDDLNYGGNSHGLKTAASLASLARGVDVYFIDANSWSFLNSDIWDWIASKSNQIRVVSISRSVPDTESWSHWSYSEANNAITAAYNAGVYIVSSIGNDGQYGGNSKPQSHRHIYAVGSIDHENRGLWWNHDYYSQKGVYSGGSEDGSNPAQEDECFDGTQLPFCSSYGSSTAHSSQAMDFVMPGHGVPTLQAASESVRTWFYGYGTSYSTPYFAAAAIIGVYGYNLGYLAKSCSTKDPTASELHQLLKNSSSESSFSTRLGWGYVSLQDIYSNAYSEGYSDAPSCGGGGGPF